LLRKIKVSINTKLLTLITSFVLGSLSAYLYFALDLFQKDKTAYIFDSTLSTTSALSKQVTESISNIINSSQLIGGIYQTEDLGKDLYEGVFKSNKSIFEFLVFREEDGQFTQHLNLKKEDILKQYRLKGDYFKQIIEKNPVNFSEIKARKYLLKNTSSIGGVPHLTLGVYNQRANEIYVTRIVLDAFIKTFNENKVYNNYLLNDKGQTYVHRDSKKVMNHQNMSTENYIQDVLSAEVSNGVREVTNSKGEVVLLAFTKLKHLGLVVLSEISKDKAFASIKELIFKSVVLAIFLMSTAFIVGFFMSRSFTKPITMLVEGTQKIAQGNFDTVVSVNASDEIGVLSDSFNFMAKEILRYMDEVKEKARMENELAVAQLVQGSFFPDSDIQLPNLDISGYYTPASECGGDWYGYLTIGDKTLVFIGDATGHGVPAALITATANAAITLIEEMVKVDPLLASSPARILTLLNKAVYAVGGKILMTFFVAVIDNNTRELVYSNASHNPPYVYRKADHEPTKNDVEVLLEKPGPRLGHKEKPEYVEGKVPLYQGDVLIMATDGILEGENPEGKQWGERRFIKSFLAAVTQPSREIVERLLKDGNEFFQGVEVDDDVTLVITKLT